MPDFSNDATGVKPAEGFEPLPGGIYKVVIVESKIEPTKAGTGELIKYQAEVIEGPHQGRKLFHQINWKNPNPEAERIGKSEQSAIQHGAGKLNIRNTEELHNVPMFWKLTIQPEKDGYPAKNRVVAVYHLSDPKAAGKVLAQASAPAANVAPSGRPPAQPAPVAPAPQSPAPPGPTWRR